MLQPHCSAISLTEHQADADIISEDYLHEMKVHDQMYEINHVCFHSPVVPQADSVPDVLTEKLPEMKAAGIRIIRIGIDCSLSELPEKVKDEREISTEKECGQMVYYHYRKYSEDIFMLFHESITEIYDTTLKLPETGKKICIAMMLSMIPVRSVMIFHCTCIWSHMNQ